MSVMSKPLRAPLRRVLAAVALAGAALPGGAQAALYYALGVDESINIRWNNLTLHPVGLYVGRTGNFTDAAKDRMLKRALLLTHAACLRLWQQGFVDTAVWIRPQTAPRVGYDWTPLNAQNALDPQSVDFMVGNRFRVRCSGILFNIGVLAAPNNPKVRAQMVSPFDVIFVQGAGVLPPGPPGAPLGLPFP